jgi:hypothetical protein
MVESLMLLNKFHVKHSGGGGTEKHKHRQKNGKFFPQLLSSLKWMKKVYGKCERENIFD